ncbi:hypothetical protein ACKI1O_49500, partial [Streptomyces scabiei]
MVVIELAAADGRSASGRAAVSVTGGEESALRRRGGVAVDFEHGSRHRVAQHAIPSRGPSREMTGRLGVDRRQSV